MENNLISALKYIDVAELDRADWISVGMALKEEGYPCSIWDDWSQNDVRYKPGKCEQKWASFRGSSTRSREAPSCRWPRSAAGLPTEARTAALHGTTPSHTTATASPAFRRMSGTLYRISSTTFRPS